VLASIRANNGWISFEHYMNQVLYTPNFGYYVSGITKFGEQGDFLTAPMLGKLFSLCLAKQCIEIFHLLPSEQERCIIEFGAGTGQLARDILDQINRLGETIDRYLIVEISAELQEQQYETILHYGKYYLNKIQWLQSLPDKGFTGVVIANELIDALPAKRFEMKSSGQAFELGVAETQGKFSWQISQSPLDIRLSSRLQKYALPAGYRSELCVQGEAWVRTVGEKLIAGNMLIIDYGFSEKEFFHPDRSDGTLMCHYRHCAHENPFFYPGLQDITVHVNFSAIKRAGEDVGLELVGYANQGSFLLSLGILEYLQCFQNTANVNIKTVLELSQQVKKLTLPHEMGEIFKVISLSRNLISPLKGFTLQNHASRL